MGNFFAKKHVLVVSQISKNNSPHKITILWDIIGQEFNDYYYACLQKTKIDKKFIFTNVPEKMVISARQRISKYSFMNIEIFDDDKRLKNSVIDNIIDSK